MYSVRKKIDQLPHPRLRAFAYAAIGMTVIDVLLGGLFFLAGAEVLGGSLAAIALGVGITLPFFFRGHYNAPRIIVPYIALAAMLVIAAFYGATHSFISTIFIGAVYPFAVFTSEERWQRAAAFPSPLLFFAGSWLDISKVFDWLSMERPSFQIDRTTESLIILASFIVVSVFYYTFSRTSDKFQSELHLAIEGLKEAHERDKATNASLNTLVQVICHDIATPLQTADLVIKSRKMDRDEKLKKVEKALGFAGDIIRNVRTLQMVKNGKVSLQPREVLLSEVLSTCTFMLADKLEEKSIELKVDIDQWLLDHPISVVPDILGQNIITNILSNAIKFSMPNSVVTVSAKYFDDGRVTISIADNGIGIPKELIDKIFLADVHTSRVGTQNEKGTGFGLPIAKTCAQLLGAQIEVISRPVSEFPDSHGTEFRILLAAS